jgi:predicted dehydrogenase
MPFPTRRDALRLAAASAAGIAFGQEPRTIGYCIVGIGRIAAHYLAGMKTSQYSRVTALVSGHRDKAEKTAAEFGVPVGSIYNYENYDAIAGNKAIDAVIVCLPNSMHPEYTIRAAQAGKHVLCEKPMCTTVADAEAMIAACRKANRKLMIAYRCHFEPMNLRGVQLIREGRLGAIHAIESINGFNIKPGEWRINRILGGGGPMMDVGIYSLNACRYLTGEEPVEWKGEMSTIDRDGRFAEVEENMSWTMKFPSGVLTSCQTSYGVSMPGWYRVRGTKGTLEMATAFTYQGQHLTAKIAGEPAIDETSPLRDPAHFPLEMDHLAECIFRNQEPKTPGEEGLRDMRLMMDIYRSAGRA